MSVQQPRVTSRNLTLDPGAFAVEAVADQAARLGVTFGEFVACAIDLWLETVSTRPRAREIPLFLGAEGAYGSEGAFEGSAQEQIRIALEPAGWRALSIEAELQGVSIERLLEHISLMLAADLDAGRLTATLRPAVS